MPRARSSRGARLSKRWVGTVAGDGIIDNVAITAAGVALASGSNFAQGDATHLRSRGELIVVATPDAAGDSDVAGLGIIRAQADAIAAGGTSLPGPLRDIGADWLWHAFVPLDAVGATAQSGASNTLNMRVTIDSKAMRRMGSNEGLVLVGEISTSEMAEVVVSGGWRFLIGF